MISSSSTPEQTLLAVSTVSMQSESEKSSCGEVELACPDTTSSELSAAPPDLSYPRRAINKASEIRHKLPKSLKLKLKILFSLVMFGSLPFILKVDLNKTLNAAMHTNPWIMAVTTVLFLATVFGTARRWQILAQAVGFNNGFGELVKYCYVGLFFNLFLPSTVGGDFSRGYYLQKGSGKYAAAFYSVLADRVSGIAVLFATATFGLLLGPGGKSLPWQLKWPIFLGTFGVFVVMPFMPLLTRRILGNNNWVTRQFNNSNAQIYWNDKKLVAAALGWSFLTQFMMVLCHIGVGLALGFGDKVPFWYYFVFYPCVAVLGFVTPSFNGIGIREWAYTYFLMMMGIDRANALTYALMWLGLTTLLSVVGGFVYVGSKLKPPPQEED